MMSDPSPHPPPPFAVVFSIAQTYSVLHDPTIDSPPIPATKVHHTNNPRVVAHLE